MVGKSGKDILKLFAENTVTQEELFFTAFK